MSKNDAIVEELAGLFCDLIDEADAETNPDVAATLLNVVSRISYVMGARPEPNYSENLAVNDDSN